MVIGLVGANRKMCFLMILYRDSLLAGTCKAEPEAFLVALVGLQGSL